MTKLWFATALLNLLPFAGWSSPLPEGSPLKQNTFEATARGETIAVITAACPGCDWGQAGREAARLRLEVDGRYSQHLFLTRGASPAEYRVLLGAFPPGRHVLTISADPGRSTKGAMASVAAVEFVESVPGQPEHDATALAPILYARPNTIGRFTDVPLLMWYETERTERGSRVRYSVIFSNEDGGTPPDRLLATWGRLTDIEYIYGIEFDREGRVIEETFQGKDHKILPFKGRRENRHPLLYVVTDNNMVADAGNTTQRYALAPVAFDLTAVSREAVMDANPWTYAVTAREARREGRVETSPRPGSKKIFDPGRYSVLEACVAPSDGTFATFSFSIGVRDDQGQTRYYDSTGGVPEYLISRSPDNFPNGCFRGAVALPRGARAEAITSLQFRAHTRPPDRGAAPPSRPPGPAHLLRVNRLFLMTSEDLPGESLFSWTGKETLKLDGGPATLQVRPQVK